MHKLAQTLLVHIRKNDLFRPGDRAGVAVSGGADSVSLLRLLLELRPELGIVLTVVHLNHSLRGPESDADEHFVRQLAARHQLEFVGEKRDVKTHAKLKKLSLEAAARKLRYEFFHSLLRVRLNRIATAHTLDDQAETVLMKMARGAGTRGLAGIYPRVAVTEDPSQVATQASGWIVRPLLSTSRKHLEAYLLEVGQSWREDASNRDLRHTRNRLRHGILPRLAKHVNPQVREALAEAGEIARAEEEYWADELTRLLPQLWTPSDNGGVLKCGLGEVPLAVRRRLLRAAGESLGLALDFRHVEEALALSLGGSLSLPDRWKISRRKGDFRFENPGPREAVDYQYSLAVPGRIAIPEAGVTIEASIVTAPETLPGGRDSGGDSPQPLLDSRFAARNLTVRNWHSGERFWPAHTKRPKKIKDLLQDLHIIGGEKKNWPVVVSGGDIVWVKRMGIRKDFQARNSGGVLIRES